MNKTLMWAFTVFVIVNIADIFTSFFILKGESNPLFLISGSIFFMYAIKIAVILGMFYIINRNVYYSHFGLYVFILIIIFGTLLMCIGVYSNIIGILNPVVLEQAAQMSSTEKIKSYGLFVSIFYLLPIALTMLSFKIYEWAVKDTNLSSIGKK